MDKGYVNVRSAVVELTLIKGFVVIFGLRSFIVPPARSSSPCQLCCTSTRKYSTSSHPVNPASQEPRLVGFNLINSLISFHIMIAGVRTGA